MKRTKKTASSASSAPDTAAQDNLLLGTSTAPLAPLTPLAYRTVTFMADPDDLLIDEHVYKLRDRKSEQYATKVQDLAESIQDQGQLQAVVVRPSTNPGEEGAYYIIAGQTRRDAVSVLRKRGVDIQLRCEMQVSPDDQPVPVSAVGAFIKAGIENFQRQNLNPLETMSLFHEARYAYGMKRTEDIAQAFHVSRATVTQHLKLAEAPEEVREALAENKITAEGALTLMGLEPAERGKVWEAAQKIAAESEGAAGAGGATGVPEPDTQAAEQGAGAPSATGASSAPNASRSAARKKAPVAAKHIRKAAEKTGARVIRKGKKAGTDPAPKLDRIKALFDSLARKAGLPSPLRAMFHTLGEWSRGKSTLAAVEAAIAHAAGQAAGQGQASPVEQAGASGKASATPAAAKHKNGDKAKAKAKAKAKSKTTARRSSAPARPTERAAARRPAAAKTKKKARTR